MHICYLFTLRILRMNDFYYIQPKPPWYSSNYLSLLPAKIASFHCLAFRRCEPGSRILASLRSSVVGEGIWKDFEIPTRHSPSAALWPFAYSSITPTQD